MRVIGNHGDQETMDLTIKTVSNTDTLNDIEIQWDSLVRESSGNPFLLTRLLKPFISMSNADGWTTMIVTVFGNEKLVGIIPLVVKRIYGLRLAKFILRPSYSPDLVIDRKDRSDFGPMAIDYIFSRLGCHIFSLDLRTNSQYISALMLGSQKSGFHCSVVSEMGHRVLPIRSTWQDFERNRGGNFRRKFRKIEHNLDKIGKWRIVRTSRNETSTEVLSKILEVEKESWKEALREKKGAKVDDVLLAIWKGLTETTQMESGLDWTVWFLEIGGHPIAYTLVITFSDAAYVTKTSYNARYRRFYPGIYVNNVAIRELCDNKNIKLIDFLTDLQFMETWTDEVEDYTRLVISKNHILCWLFGTMFVNGYLKKTFGPVIDGILDRIPGLAGI